MTNPDDLAFPTTSPNSPSTQYTFHPGYIKREDFALRLMVALLQNPHTAPGGPMAPLADKAVLAADELIERLNR